jgi:SAM-dependent methyltransferase
VSAGLPFAEACERNKAPIAEALESELPEAGRVLEIGSGTGQHVVYFARKLPGWTWQPSDRAENLSGLSARLDAEGAANILDPLQLDVTAPWPPGTYDAVYSSNTAHIMYWDAVQAMFRGVAGCLTAGGTFCLYGPFNEDGRYTAPGNAAFDRQLRQRDPGMGLRDIEALETLAGRHGLGLERRLAMPANNQVLVFRKEGEQGHGI